MRIGKNRIAITGLGIISCLGLDRNTVQQSLQDQRCGIKLLESRKNLGFQSGLSGVIKGFDDRSVLNRKQRKSLPEHGLWAWAAVEQALEQAGIGREDLREDAQTGLIFGNDTSAATAVEQVDILRQAGETRTIGSGHIFRLLNSSITLNISTILGIRGHSWTISSACAGGVMAIGQAAELIATGRQQRVICGGAQEINWQSMCSFDALGAFSRREWAPQHASRPFDLDRDGLVPGGGAAALILEEWQTAVSRDAVILGEVLGYGNTSDGYHIVTPSGEGLLRAMEMALSDAGLTTADLDLVLAHATSTLAGDKAEAVALCSLFQIGDGRDTPPVTALKALTGHEFWMAGAAQVVYGLLMGRGGFIAGNPNLENPDPAARGLHFVRRTVKQNFSIMLCNAAGFGGTNGCLIVRNCQAGMESD